ncbi:MAG: electron transport complex subunit RsxG [Gammaproteobacteria bacterium]
MSRNILVSALILGVFGFIGATLVAVTEFGTHERILENERQALLHQLYEIVPKEEVDNDILAHPLTVSARDALGQESSVIYVGEKANELSAMVFEATVPDGYSGPIRLLVGVDRNGVLLGTRVIAHKETPGLGDKIEKEKSDWILGFTGKSLTDPKLDRWKVKKDGGEFDQFTGATVTPRAVVNGVKRVLLYFDQQKDALYKEYLDKAKTNP